jgi:hypothetical protein
MVTKQELSGFRKRWGGWFWLSRHLLIVASFIAMCACLVHGGVLWEVTGALSVVTVAVVWFGKRLFRKSEQMYVDYFVSRGISRERAIRYWDRENID